MSQPNYPPQNPQQPYSMQHQQPPPQQPGAAAVPPPVPPIQPTYSSCNHVLHLILSVLTLGFWLLIWPCVYIAVTVSNNSKRKQYEEDLKAYNRDYWQWQQSQSR